MLTCEEQISAPSPQGGKTFSYMKHIRPRRALIIDEQNGLVGMFPLFVHDGTRRGAPPDAPPGMLQNLVTIGNVRYSRRVNPRGGSVPLRDASLRAGEWVDGGIRALKTQDFFLGGGSGAGECSRISSASATFWSRTLRLEA